LLTIKIRTNARDGARHRFLFTPTSCQVQSHQTWTLHNISWAYTSPHISHPSLHSLRPASPAYKVSASLPNFLSHSQIKNTSMAPKEMKAIQAVDTQVTTLFSAKATPTALLGCPRTICLCILCVMEYSSRGGAFEASFRLHRSNRFLLPDTVRSHLRYRVCLPVCLPHRRADQAENHK